MRSARAAGWRAVLSPRTRFASCCGSGASPRAAHENVGQPRGGTGMNAQSEGGDLAQPGEIPRALLEYLAECLVDAPEKISVERFEGDGGTIVLELCVGPDDYGRVIGRGGRTPPPPRARGQTAATRGGRARAVRHVQVTGARDPLP